MILRCASLDRGARYAAAHPMRPALHADRCSCSAAGAGDADAEDANAPSDGRVADAEVRILRKLARSQVRSYDLNPPLPCAPAALSWCSAARSVASRNAVDGATAMGAAISRRSRFTAGVALQTTWRTCRGLLAACRSRPFASMRSPVCLRCVACSNDYLAPRSGRRRHSSTQWPPEAQLHAVAAAERQREKNTSTRVLPSQLRFFPHVQGLRRVSNDISDRAPHRDLVQSPISAALGASLSRDRARLHRAAMARTAWWLGLGSSLTIPSPCSYAPYGDRPVSPSTFGSKGSSDRAGAACRGALGSHSGQLTTAAGGGAVAVPTRTVCAAQFSSLARLAATRSNEADA